FGRHAIRMSIAVGRPERLLRRSLGRIFGRVSSCRVLFGPSFRRSFQPGPSAPALLSACVSDHESDPFWALSDITFLLWPPPGAGLRFACSPTVERNSTMTRTSPLPQPDADGRTREVDAVVVGAGLSGLYMLHRLRSLGLSVQAFDGNEGVGGTWYANRYPGARVDVKSLDYAYSFDPDLEQEWEWTEKYPAQEELLRYIDHVADRFGLRPHIRLRTRVTQAEVDEGAERWHVRTDRGDRVTAQFLIMATGCLSVPRLPDVPGLDRFRGRWHHTAQWPEEGVDLAGKRVAVIGTASSGVQVIPLIAEQAEHLTVFQRTPNFVIPANNHPLRPEDQRAVKARYAEVRKANRESGFGVAFP